MPDPPPLAGSILDVIGATPLVELTRSVAPLGLRGRLLAKLESVNPGLSKKDRAALELVRCARENGLLKPGQTVVALTSGNMGAGLAVVCRALGHPFVAVMSRGNSVERARQMTALGAEVVLVDQAPGAVPGRVSGADLERVFQRTAEVVAERAAFEADQFADAACVAAHEKQTGPEIWTQSGGQVDAFVDIVGTGASFTGIARYLRRQNASVRTYLLEPAGAAVLAGRPATEPGHKLQGAGYCRTELPLLDRSLVTDFVQVTDAEALAAARHLAAQEGILGGFTTGAHLAAAWNLLAGRESGATIVFLVCDSGLKYMSTDLYQDGPTS
jgi:cysteine synthase